MSQEPRKKSPPKGDGKSLDVKLPPLNEPTEPQPGPLPNPDAPDQRLGFAVVGLGQLSLAEIIPGLERCKHAKLTALVSGDPEKMKKIATQYGVKASNCYSYETYDEIKDNTEVDVIYIVLPNSMHHEYTIRGARAGKHILCEKPMANSVKECEEMIAACKDAGKKLMIAYRIQYEPLNRLAKRDVRAKKFGATKIIQSAHCQSQKRGPQWRLKLALAGGGSLPDIGLYCLNTTRFLLGEEPEEVFAYAYSTPGDDRFKDIEETIAFTLRFPSGAIAQCTSSYGTYGTATYTVHGETGTIKMDPGFSYGGLQQERGYAIEGKGLKEQPANPMAAQFSVEMDHMALCVREDRTPYTPGEEGLQDQRVMEAIYQSARDGKPVKLTAGVGKIDPFRGDEPKELEE